MVVSLQEEEVVEELKLSSGSLGSSGLSGVFGLPGLPGFPGFPGLLGLFGSSGLLGFSGLLGLLGSFGSPPELAPPTSPPPPGGQKGQIQDGPWYPSPDGPPFHLSSNVSFLFCKRRLRRCCLSDSTWTYNDHCRRDCVVTAICVGLCNWRCHRCWCRDGT